MEDSQFLKAVHGFVPGITKKYSETVVPRIIKAACEVLEEDNDTLMEFIGGRFPKFVGKSLNFY